jgi:hypothetical protein
MSYLNDKERGDTLASVLWIAIHESRSNSSDLNISI